MKQDIPKFSVVICTYQRPQLLPRAIQSVLDQTFQDFELIVVDDCSTDDICQVVADFQDDRIRFFRNSVNGGMGRSWNVGFEAAVGEFIALLDDDDEYESTFLEETNQHLSSHDVAFCWCGIRVFRPGDTPPRENLVELTATDRPSRQMIAVLIGSGFGLTFRRDCLEIIGTCDEKLRACNDVELFLNLVQKPWEWSCLPKFLVRVHRQTERMTLHNRRHGESLDYIVDKHRDFLDGHPVMRSVLYFQLGTILANAGERQWARRKLGGYLRRVPGDTRVWSAFLSNELRHTWLGRWLLKIYRWFFHRYQG